MGVPVVMRVSVTLPPSEANPASEVKLTKWPSGESDSSHFRM